jgi:hypothetical protein
MMKSFGFTTMIFVIALVLAMAITSGVYSQKTLEHPVKHKQEPPVPRESPKESTQQAEAEQIYLSLKDGATVHCSRGPDGNYRFEVIGKVLGLRDNKELLFWVRPVKPPSETAGWYLQRDPFNGIRDVEGNGSWRGVGQIGNIQWLPAEGDTFDVAVTLVDSHIAEQLLNGPGVVTRIKLPGEYVIASALRVEL